MTIGRATNSGMLMGYSIPLDTAVERKSKDEKKGQKHLDALVLPSSCFEIIFSE
ncbi:hypothetical protein [Trichococcus alkaliphilus]|uniref:hypothetical protein n=1 Tax=Trichococcus alkaliphilus TaxID=2052943 RepID=UPI001374BB34|nr:hypothetical protein [Trichococcus alkaliphilus]